jgi:hypothetical protein
MRDERRRFEGGYLFVMFRFLNGEIPIWFCFCVLLLSLSLQDVS